MNTIIPLPTRDLIPRAFTPRTRTFASLSLISIFLAVTTASAQQSGELPASDSLKGHMLSDVEVTGKQRPVDKTALSTEQSAGPSSVSVLGRDYIAKQAVNSYGDLLRPIVGVNVANYQVGGVGYGIEMRGYVATEHARDIAFSIDGVPQNQGSSLQANGYTDLNPLIPEIIRSFEVVRGPFSPLYGDHALGGAIAFHTEDRIQPGILLSYGTYGFTKVQAACNFNNSNNGKGGYVIVEGFHTNGYRDNSIENRLNGFGKYSFPMLRGKASVRLQSYTGRYGSASYVNRADIDAGTIPVTFAVNPTDYSAALQQNAVFNYRDDDTMRYNSATVYVQHSDFRRFRTGAVGGQQTEGRDNRTWTGFDLRHTRRARIGTLPILYYGGLSLRADFTEATRYNTLNGGEQYQTRNRTINTYTPSAYGQIQFKPIDRVKISIGARYDQLLYDIKTAANDSNKANVAVSPSTNAFSPKIGAALELARGLNLFANVARGFKAPGGFDEIIYNSSLQPSRLLSYEAGLSYDDNGGRYHGLISGYVSDQSGEIQTDPFGNLINFGNTRRSGIEAEGRVNFGRGSGFSLYANYTQIVAKITNAEGPGDAFVTNTPTYLGLLGIDYDFGAARNAANRVVLSVYDQVIGPKNLSTDGTIQSKAFQRLSGRLSYTRRSWQGFRVYVQSTAYLNGGELEEMGFLSGGKLVTAPQAPFTLDGGVKIPF